MDEVDKVRDAATIMMRCYKKPIVVSWGTVRWNWRGFLSWQKWCTGKECFRGQVYTQAPAAMGLNRQKARVLYTEVVGSMFSFSMTSWTHLWSKWHSFLVMSKGLETPAGTWVRVLWVQVEVRMFGPLWNPHPQCGWWVTCTVLQWVESWNKLYISHTSTGKKMGA